MKNCSATPTPPPRRRRSPAPPRSALVSLGERVTETLPLISARREELKAAEDKLQELRAQQAALSALRVPDGVEKLDADLAAGRVDWTI